MSDSLVFKLNDDNSLMLRDHTEKIINSLQSISKEFLKVGYLLWEVNKYKWYELAGYESIIEYSNNELSLRKSQTYNFINVIERFGLVENGSKKYMKLKEGFEDYNFSQLCEMLPIDDDKIKLINPDMSCKTIRELKKTLEENERIEIINDKIENKEIQVLKGQKSIFDKDKEEIKEVQTTGIDEKIINEKVETNNNEINKLNEKIEKLTQDNEIMIKAQLNEEKRLDEYKRRSVEFKKDDAIILMTFLDTFFNENLDKVNEIESRMNKSKKFKNKLESDSVDLIGAMGSLSDSLNKIINNYCGGCENEKN